MKSFQKKKQGTALGFRTPEFFRGKTFKSGGMQGKFNASQFKTQHKGGS